MNEEQQEEKDEVLKNNTVLEDHYKSVPIKEFYKKGTVLAEATQIHQTSWKQQTINETLPAANRVEEANDVQASTLQIDTTAKQTEDKGDDSKAATKRQQKEDAKVSALKKLTQAKLKFKNTIQKCFTDKEETKPYMNNKGKI